MRPEFENIELVNNQEKGQYELHYNGYFAYITYEEEEGALAMHHTIAPDELRGTGVAGALVEKMISEVRKINRQIRPYCSYLQAQIRKHPEWKDVVDPQFTGYDEL